VSRRVAIDGPLRRWSMQLAAADSAAWTVARSSGRAALAGAAAAIAASKATGPARRVIAAALTVTRP
jgi:hypothetical protein